MIGYPSFQIADTSHFKALNMNVVSQPNTVHNHFTVTAVPAKKGHLSSLLKPLFKVGFKRSNRAHVPELLLHSNLPPSDSERAAVCNVVAVVEQDIAKLQQKSAFSRRGLSLRTELLRAHTAVLSPVRWVPPEVLEQIFQHCTCEFDPDQNSHWRQLPWAVSQVCQSWRDITLSLPYLWNRIPIHLETNTWPNLEAQASFLIEVLARSQNAPLYLYIHAPFKEYDWHPLINALVPHSERVEELSIASCLATMNAFQKFCGRLPLLRKLTLSKTSRRNFPNSAIINVFEEAPLLREVTLNALYTYEIMLPWLQLTSFNGIKINRAALRQVVANSLDLERLEISGHCYGTGPKVVTLHRLTSLKVKLKNSNITSNFFFGSLNLPIVEEIGVEEYQGDLIPHLIPMLSRCPIPSVLRKLVLGSVALEAPRGNLTALLKLTPQLLELELQLPPISDLFELIMRPESPPLVPMLETLIIHANTGEASVWETIPATSLARSRCEIDDAPTGSFQLPFERRKLKTFRLIFPDLSSCDSAQAELNEWFEFFPNSKSARDLKLWKHMLHEQLPELDHKPPPRKRKFDLKFAQRLDRLLTAIEEFQLDDVKGLYASGLHASLRRLRYVRPNHIPGGNVHHFQMRSHVILNKWAPSLRKHLSLVHWVTEGTKSLIYIPLNDALRESPEALNMVYGLNEDEQFEDNSVTSPNS